MKKKSELEMRVDRIEAAMAWRETNEGDLHIRTERDALNRADLLLEGAQDKTRGATKVLHIRQAIYKRLKELDAIVKSKQPT